MGIWLPRTLTPHLETCLKIKNLLFEDKSKREHNESESQLKNVRKHVIKSKFTAVFPSLNS